ncbi:uncharacterized protein [Dysidea avara]|uniref:uncharacterized protein isoform X5 n=1 Tax=Dysidea avara TaxID=196820 RepID=UPI00331DECA4
MNFSACWIVSSDIETGVFGVATDVPDLGIECHEFQVSLRTEELYYCNCCFCSYQLSLYTSDVNLQCLLDCVIRYRNKCFWCCDRCSRSQYCHADIQEIITIVGTIF